ncbi:MAG: acyltransferase [bacterium]|jgi:hypothetical protein
MNSNESPKPAASAQPRKTRSLPEYVKKINGVPLGASGSLGNMINRSVGARSFYLFWHYWNPIWGYYLSRNVMKPLTRYFSTGIATLLTFAVSGAIHDFVVSLVLWRGVFFFTPWFVIMSLAVLASKKFHISYGGYPLPIRMSINLAWLLVCFLLASAFEPLYA